MPNGTGADGNGLAVAGFVLALISLFLGWIPYFGWVIWLHALIFSCVALAKTKKPGVGRKGLAIAGLVISLVSLFINVLVLIGIFGFYSYYM
jgi:hypothetical protein